MADGTSGRWSRREFLAGVAMAASAAAGCVEGPGGPTAADTTPGRSTAPGTATGGTDAGTPGGTDATGGDAYEWTTVTAYDANGTRLAAVDARVADTAGKRYTGLSETTSLPPDEGMWFVHPEEGRQAYVMRGMSFPLDIVFVDGDGTVTRIFHADTEGTAAPYEARAKYVLEVNRGWANRTGLEEGDRVRADP